MAGISEAVEVLARKFREPLQLVTTFSVVVTFLKARCVDLDVTASIQGLVEFLFKPEFAELVFAFFFVYLFTFLLIPGGIIILTMFTFLYRKMRKFVSRIESITKASKVANEASKRFKMDDWYNPICYALICLQILYISSNTWIQVMGIVGFLLAGASAFLMGVAVINRLSNPNQ